MTQKAIERVRVVVDQPESMNLLGLLMKGLLAKNLSDDDLFYRARAAKTDVLVQAGEMKVTLRLGEGGITILRGDAGSAGASVAGDMKTLLGVVAEGKMVAPFLSGRLKIGGNPLVLLRMLPMIRAR
ncbi:MAG: hypothetical protein HY897_18185 [Deltaproteobacteria bacterium]|nr:hypothetical protein [Deltaproteobacteria bacterium]